MVPVSVLGIIAIVIVVVVIVASTLGKNAAAEAAEARNAFAGDLRNGKINTPSAFQSRCRAPESTRQTEAGTELRYESAEIYVIFAKSGPPVLETESLYSDESGRVKSYRTAASPTLVFDVLGCR
jgi:hypothetical protein